MEEKLFVRGKNEDADPPSVHPAVIGHACRAAAEASLAVSFVSVPSGSGWMKLGAQEARRLRWEVYFVSHSWFYFSTAGVKTDIAARGSRRPPPGLPARTSRRRRSLLWGVQGLWQKEWSGSFVSVLFCFYNQSVSVQENHRKKRRNWWIRTWAKNKWVHVNVKVTQTVQRRKMLGNQDTSQQLSSVRVDQQHEWIRPVQFHLRRKQHLHSLPAGGSV